MKKIIACAFLFFLIGCLPVKQVIPDKEIPDDVWDGLSEDLSNIYVLVETINKNLKTKRVELKVEVDNWKYPIDEKISLITASKTENYPIVKIGEVKIPTAKGFIVSDIFKTQSKEGNVWFATEKKPKIEDLITASAVPNAVKLESKIIPFYTYGILNDKTKAIPAIEQIVLFDSLIDKAFREINEAIKYVQKKYKDSPIYIEGFQVHFGINFSVDIMFKIKR